MRRRLILAILALCALARTSAAQTCPNTFTGIDYPSVLGRPWTVAELEARLLDNIVALCTAGGGSGSPEGNQYHPDREPGTGLVVASSDEFENGLEATWRWANQGGATDTAALDTALLSTTGAGATAIRARWVDAPAGGTDFTLTGKFTPSWNIISGGSANARLCGLIVLVTGSEATPTALRTLAIREGGTGTVNFRHGTTADYSTAPTSVAEQSNLGPLTLTAGSYLQLRYAQAAKVLSSYVSADGLTWVSIGTETLSAHPVSIGRFVNAADGSGVPTFCRAHWFRTCTSAACLAGDVGE